MGYLLSRRKQGSEVFTSSDKSRCNTSTSHVNIIKSNHLKTPNSDNDIGTPNFPHRNVQYGSSFNTLINLQKLIDTESTVSINDDITDKNIMSEGILISSKFSRKT